jgi:transcriptional regulator with XRE-family HTH domain
MKIPIDELVDARPASDHIRGLFAKGMLVSAMAEQSGLSDRTIRGYVNGYVQAKHGNRPVDRCLPGTLKKILAIRFEPAWTGEGFSREKFRRVREAKGLSRKAVAEAARLDSATIQHWEVGRSMPVRKLKLDAALAVLGVGWEDVSGPVDAGEPGEDCYQMVFSDGRVASDDDFTNDYPCQVCGGTFRSRLVLATHSHPKAKVSV